jgi:error-prone DNA polymerase
MPDTPLTPGLHILAIAKEEGFVPNPPAPFVELGVTTPYSFLRGASPAVQLAEMAYRLGYHALGVADRNTMAGVVRMDMNLRGGGIQPVIGCRLDLVDAPSFLAYPRDRAAYGWLCTLLSRGKRHDLAGKWQAKGECHLTLEMLAAHSEGVHLIVLPPDDLEGFSAELAELTNALPTLRHIAAAYLYRGDDRARINRLDAIAHTHRLSILATNDVHYATPDRRPLQDVMTCIREKTTIARAGYLLHANAERHLKSPAEMIELFRRWPHAIAATREVADACRFKLQELRYEYPDDPIPEGRTPQQHLEVLAREGADWRYPNGIPEKVAAAIRKELDLIARLDIARYFITVYDIVAYARSLDPPILCQGRGSAANSAVCYCLAITNVDPEHVSLLFERFISVVTREDGSITCDAPDIDVDFEHERREEVIQHIYDRYGRDHAGLCATVIHYRPRSAVREVGKAMGLGEDVTSAMARTVWGSWGSEVDELKVKEAGLDLTDPELRRVIAITNQLMQLPRHLSQHVGGFILTRNPLIENVPIGNGAMADRSFIEWDKDDIDYLELLKVDVLALGMLTCIRKAFDLIEEKHGEYCDLASILPKDETVYDMLCAGESLGVFQVESRAQMNMLPRLKPRSYYDLVVEVAIVRPGPIQGDMVHPYLRRRNGIEKVEYPSPSPDKGPPDELKKILNRTLGVPIFQEQAMQIAMDAAEFSPEEATELRRAMATFRSRGTIGKLEEKMVGRMIGRGYDPEFARRCFDQIKGFGDYGFPESHAASFAHLVYVSSWIKCYYPDVFAAALLNSQPMGFYAPAQIVRDAKENGVEVLHPDANLSEWDNSLEPIGLLRDHRPHYPPAASVFARWKGDRDETMREGGLRIRYALRLGFRQIDGIGEDVAKAIMAARDVPFADVEDLKARSGIHVAAIRKLAAADAFRSMGLDRRQALWDSRTLRQAPDLPLFTFADTRDEGAEAVPVQLPATPLAEHVVSDYQTLRLSLKAHPLEFLRGHYDRRRFTRNQDLRTMKSGGKVAVSGLVLIRQRPGTASGVCFITIEDETGVANLVVWPKIFDQYRKVVMTARLMEVRGYVQSDENVVHVVAQELVDATGTLAALSDDLLRAEVARADHVVKPLPTGLHRHPRNVSIIPKSRDFH